MLLLGAGGFAGSHLRSAAEEAGLRVVGASRRGEQAELSCDLLDPESVERAVAEAEPRLVVNMAGMASVRQSWKHPKSAFAVNAGGVQNLLEAVSGGARDA